MNKSRPIIMSGEMVRAILNGNKTMTRRLIKPQPSKDLDKYYKKDECRDWLSSFIRNNSYGKIGDELWVKETLRKIQLHNERIGVEYDAGGFKYGISWKWKNSVLPSIFMPKKACRLFLEITDIKVERLQDINVDDAIKEGIDINYEDIKRKCNISIIDKFQEYWDKINKKPEYQWNANPWVWVIEFKKIK